MDHIHTCICICSNALFIINGSSHGKEICDHSVLDEARSRLKRTERGTNSNNTHYNRNFSVYAIGEDKAISRISLCKYAMPFAVFLFAFFSFTSPCSVEYWKKMAYQLWLCSLGNHDDTAHDEIEANINALNTLIERTREQQVWKLRELKKRNKINLSRRDLGSLSNDESNIKDDGWKKCI